MSGEERKAKPIRPKDLAESVPAIAEAARRVAHFAWNFIRPPRDIYGWEENVRAPDFGGDGVTDLPVEPRYERVRKACDGWVPRDMLQAGADASRVHTEDGVEWVHVEDLQPYLVSRFLLTDSHTRVVFTYTVDVPHADGKAYRHLSVQIPVPGKVLQGELVAVQGTLLEQCEPICAAFLPAAALGVPVRAGMRAGEPWQVIDPDKPLNVRAAVWKTPVLFDFIMDHDLGSPVDDAPKRRVTLYGPDGSPV